MTKVIVKTLVQRVAEYSNAVGRYGPDSEQARRIRNAKCNLGDSEFLDYADALDRIKLRLGGSGIDPQMSSKQKVGVA